MELIGHYDPLLNEHLEKVRNSQRKQERLQVHYLSSTIQNEIIDCCGRKVETSIIDQIKAAKYYSIIIDATPDNAHIEQNAFIFRFLYYDSSTKCYEVKEKFLCFEDCCKKMGEEITDLICAKLEMLRIPLADCRGQIYDNGSNMSGAYKGVQKRILDRNPLALYSPCACHTLNLCGVDAAKCCPEAVKFFGIVQKCYNIFSSSPQRWKILLDNIPCSLHTISDTRWSARREAVKPFSSHLPGLVKAIDEVLALNIPPETVTDLKGIKKYITSFKGILMASIWYKILTPIDNTNIVLQARNATLDVELKNIENLKTNLCNLRDQWDSILQECKLIAENLAWDSSLQQARAPGGCRTKDFLIHQSEETKFKISVFYFILDSVIGGLQHRFNSVQKINDRFSFLWSFRSLDTETLLKVTKEFVAIYKADVGEEFVQEMEHLKCIDRGNLEGVEEPLELLNKITSMNLEPVFPNICTALRIFLTIPVTVASAERSLNVLQRIKNFSRATMKEDRLNGLAILSIESAEARLVKFDDIIDDFAQKKARKANMYS